MFDKILASSLDNFMILPNKQITPFPTVTFHIEGQLNDGAFITFEDRNNPELFQHTITAKNGATSTSKEFNPITNGNMANFALFDSLRQCAFIYDASIDMDGIITCSLDSSRTYRIYGEWTRGNLRIEGTYTNYVSTEMPKSVLNLSGDNFSFSMEKYSPDTTVSFNVSAPFTYTQSKHPIKVRMNGYQSLNGSNMPMPLPYSNMLILPTTLKKFEVFNESDFYTSTKQNFLCSNTAQTIGFASYKEWLYDSDTYKSDVAMLSIIADDDDNIDTICKYKMHQRFYSPSGKLIYESGDGQWFDGQMVWSKAYNNGRIDFSKYLHFFPFADNYTEYQIGRIEVYVTKNDEKVSNVYTFYPSYGCNRSTIIYFINKYGGVQTADFFDGYEVQSSIEDAEVYFTNPTEDRVGNISNYPFEDCYKSDDPYLLDEIERVKTKRRNDTYIVKKICDKKEAEWLKELQSSKNVWIAVENHQFDSNGQYHLNAADRWQTIIVDSLDINMSDAQDEYELTLTFHKSDNNLRI